MDSTPAFTRRMLCFVMASLLFGNFSVIAAPIVSSPAQAAVYFPDYSGAPGAIFPANAMNEETSTDSEAWDISADGSIVGIYEDTSVEPDESSVDPANFGKRYPHKAFITTPSKTSLKMQHDRYNEEDDVLRLDGNIANVVISENDGVVVLNVCDKMYRTKSSLFSNYKNDCHPYLSPDGEFAPALRLKLIKGPEFHDGSYRVYDISPNGRFLVGKEVYDYAVEVFYVGKLGAGGAWYYENHDTGEAGLFSEIGRRFGDRAFYYYLALDQEKKLIPVERVLKQGNHDHAALGISGDNNTIVGYSYSMDKFRPNSSNSPYYNSHVELYDDSRAFLYYIDRDEIIDIGSLKAGNTGAAMATAISTDGSTVVGTSDYDDNAPVAQGIRKEHAFSYDVASGRMTDLGSLANESYATSVNRDGSAIVGYSNMGDGRTNAFYYDANSQSMIALAPTEVDGSAEGYGYAAFKVNGDGSVVVGRRNRKQPQEGEINSEAVLWKVKRNGSLPVDSVSPPSPNPPQLAGVPPVDNGLQPEANPPQLVGVPPVDNGLQPEANPPQLVGVPPVDNGLQPEPNPPQLSGVPPVDNGLQPEANPPQLSGVPPVDNGLQPEANPPQLAGVPPVDNGLPPEASPPQLAGVPPVDNGLQPEPNPPQLAGVPPIGGNPPVNVLLPPDNDPSQAVGDPAQVAGVPPVDNGLQPEPNPPQLVGVPPIGGNPPVNVLLPPDNDPSQAVSDPAQIAATPANGPSQAVSDPAQIAATPANGPSQAVGDPAQVAATSPANGSSHAVSDPAQIAATPANGPSQAVSDPAQVAATSPANGSSQAVGDPAQIAATPANGPSQAVGDPAQVAATSPANGSSQAVGDPAQVAATSPANGPSQAVSDPAQIFDITMVEVDNSRKTFVKMAEKDNALHALYRGNLQSLGTDHCALEDKAYCIGAFATANRVYHGGHEVNTGIHGAVRLAPQWHAGVSVAYLADDNLPGGIESRDSHTPGVGAYLRYAQNPDASGLSLTASAAYQEQELAIRRTTIGETEPGSGDSGISGKRFALEGSYGVALDEKTLLSSSLGVQQLQTRREGYREARDAEFPATYGRSGEKNTALQIAMGVDHDLTENFSLHADAGTRVVLDRDRDAFTVQEKYIGGFVDNLDEQVDVMPYANAGVSARWGADRGSLARLRVGIAKSEYGDNDANIGFSYDYRF